MNTALATMGDAPPDMFGGAPVPMGLRIMLDEGLFQRATKVADMMSGAKGYLPKHVVGNTNVCFAIVVTAFNCRLDPYYVARHTFVTAGTPEEPGGIGHDSALCRAMLESSGFLEGSLRYEFHGDWSKVQGKFVTRQSDRGKSYQVKGWDDKDEEGLAITVTGKLRGDATPCPLTIELKQAQPRNSTLWATDPRQQLSYLASRRWGNLYCPQAFAGARFEGDAGLGGVVIDVTPVEPEPAKARSLDDIVAKAVDVTPTEHVDPETGEVTEKPKQATRKPSLRQRCQDVRDAIATGDLVNAEVAWNEIEAEVREKDSHFAEKIQGELVAAIAQRGTVTQATMTV